MARGMRSIYEETFKWAHQRKVFGKPLIAQAVIRQKFAAMLARVRLACSFFVVHGRLTEEKMEGDTRSRRFRASWSTSHTR